MDAKKSQPHYKEAQHMETTLTMLSKQNVLGIKTTVGSYDSVTGLVCLYNWRDFWEYDIFIYTEKNCLS